MITDAEVEEIGAEFMRVACEIWREQGSLQPMAILAMPAHGEKRVAGLMPVAEAAGPDGDFRQALRGVLVAAVLGGSEFVGTIVEGWTLPSSAHETMDRAVRGEVRISECPERVTALLVCLATRERRWLWIARAAEIEGERLVEEPALADGVPSDRFTDALPWPEPHSSH